MRRALPWIVLAVALIAAGIVLAVVLSDDDEQAATSSTTTLTGTVTTRPTVTTTVPAPTMQAVPYFSLQEKVQPVGRTVPKTDQLLRAAMTALLAGPTQPEKDAGISTQVPAKTRILGLTVKDEVATVDLSGDFASGGGSLSMSLRLAEVVFTATGVPGVRAVSLKLDGKPATTLGGEGLIVPNPVDRKDLEDETPPILVETPLSGDLVRCPIEIAGTSNVFEANMNATVAAPGAPLPKPAIVTATSGSGTRGDFTSSLSCPDGAGAGTKLVMSIWSPSAEDGSRDFEVNVPVQVR